MTMKRGRMIRPKAVVLNESAIPPDKNLIKPPPNQFSHTLNQAQPYFYDSTRVAGPPDGEFATGTQVLLMCYKGGSYCRVVNEHGLYVETAYAGLRQL